jgi:hypothetical protein
LYLVDGSIGGLLTAEIMNWTGHVMAAPRSKLGELLKRDEASRTGVYILLGDDPNSLGGDIAYIGEGDAVDTRLKKHNLPEDKGGKDFWNRVIVLTSKDANLTKAHVRYLESRFIALANEARRARLLNGTVPDPIRLPEADKSDMEYFIGQARIILPVLGVSLLRPQGVHSSADNESTPSPVAVSPVFEMSIPRGGKARAQELDGEFIVLAGSGARSVWVSSKTDSSCHRLWESLQSSGVLASTDDEGVLTFRQDQIFTSPSAAAAVIAGTATRNGRIEWKVEGTSTTYADWQTQVIEGDDK